MSARKRRVCVVITARPSYARIKTALEAIRARADLELQLVVAASALLDRYGRVIEVMRADGFEPTATVYMLVEGENLVTSAKSTGIGIMELATIFDNLRPDIVLSVADRYETIATAIAASYLNLPVAHVQGGEVTGSIDEKVRHAVTKLSNLHFVANRHAAARVERMGEAAASIYVTGCPSIDLAARVQAENDSRLDVLAVEGGQGVGHAIDTGRDYLVVMQHPVPTEFDQAGPQVEATLRAIRRLGLPTFWFWPNVDAGSDATSKAIRRFRELHDPDNIYFLKNLAPENFLRLLKAGRGIIGNSSVAIRECAFLGVPAVNIGSRQSRRERGPNVIDVPHSEDAIVAAVERHRANGRYPSSTLYGDGGAGPRIAELLATLEPVIEKQITY
jgi:UDP-hydrolysing UDP-N-acetyl-D-glucosamine 2-epimerase